MASITFHCIACESKLELANAYVIGEPYRSPFDALKSAVWRCPQCGLVVDDFNWQVSGADADQPGAV